MGYSVSEVDDVRLVLSLVPPLDPAVRLVPVMGDPRVHLLEHSSVSRVETPVNYLLLPVLLRLLEGLLVDALLTCES